MIDSDSLTPQLNAAMTRRQFFRRSTGGIAIGIPALATLLTAVSWPLTCPAVSVTADLPRRLLTADCSSSPLAVTSGRA